MGRFVDKIILHCSASDLPNQDAALIDQWHRARGFAKIGYHYFITTAGQTQKGRSHDEIGAHCEGENAHSLGICLAGLASFHDAQFDALRVLLTQLKPLYPKATVHPHNEFPSAKRQGKICPVFDVQPYIQLYVQSTLERTKGEKLWNFKTFIGLLSTIFLRFFKRS